MSRLRLLTWTLAALSIASCGPVGAAPDDEGGERATSTSAAGAAIAERPRLVVLISVDQLRADYLTRFEDLFLPPGTAAKPGGFRWFAAQQANFSDAHHDHFPTYTGPGHAVLLTGAPPSVSGIVGNQWFDRALNRKHYCAEGRPNELSPESLDVTTLGDELEMSTGGRARTFAFGMKDRAAILMAGHVSDGVFWYDDQTGTWATSEWYTRRGATLPKWLEAWNAEHFPDQCFGKSWEFSAGAPALARIARLPGEAAPTPFEYKLNAGKVASPSTSPEDAMTYYRNVFAPTPYANDWVVETALRCVRNEGLGQDEVPDLLMVNLSTNDYVGHRFGPDSAEVLDITVQTDKALAALLLGLASSVPGGLQSVVVVVTGDHGVAPNPARAQAAGLPAGVQAGEDTLVNMSPQRAAVEAALDEAYGAAIWTLAHVEQAIYLNDAAFAAHPEVSREAAEGLAAAVCRRTPGTYDVYTASQIRGGRMPDTAVARAVCAGFHPGASGDLIIVPDPFWSPIPRQGATHGSPWTYDSHVPLLISGAAIRAGHFRGRVSTLDIAATLAELLGVAQPSGNQGRILAEAFK